MQRRTQILLGAIALWSWTALSGSALIAQEVIVAPILNPANQSLLEPPSPRADEPMIRVAAVPKDPLKPTPPAENKIVELVITDDLSEEKERKSDLPAKAIELPAGTLEPMKAADEEPAELMEDENAKPINESEAEANEPAKSEVSPEETRVAKPEIKPIPETPLPQSVQALQPRIARVLDYYYQYQMTDAGKHDVWETMHGFLPYGVDSQIRTPEYRQPVNAIGWICWNKPCRGHRLFEIKNGKLIPRQGPRVQGHHGQFLAMLAQSYVPASFEIQAGGQQFTVQDIIEFEKETCVPKSELTFKLISLSHYLPADATWKSRDGQDWSLQRLLEEEIQQKVVGAACGGTHRLTGIAFAVAARKKAGLPMEGIWERADEYLQQYHAHTFRIQNTDGSFSTNWFEGRGMDRDVDRRLQTTGHILEFLILSLPQEELTSPKIVNAVNYLTTILERNPRHEWSIGPKGHALHALVLYDQLVFGTKPGSRTSEILQTSHD
ncbi:hypothetical protein [Blastopirellula marina]|uniref:Uncharacterized protein n=1 Tax=Blastopirellula marina TaxID=124 RepID=A0A2S8G932_9BACT|nr:hypothetical protein [Blastopirellula marina]PQO40927.1 hypothetical protein C5Y98_04935 [Blastopirellula marina]PTL45809.1 hypothetical protein C5Y97_04935 [Blastopirellula marina]